MYKKAVILAGGLGKRLEPFTRIIPKPLLPIGETTVMEIQIQYLKDYGVKDIYVATNYRADYIEAFLGNGSKYGIEIHYSKEEEPLGTCGPVLLLKEELNEPFLLMNGDVLTTLDFRKLFAFSTNTEADLIVCTKIINTPFSFGKVYSENGMITKVEEKPDLSLEILAGIYVLKPSVLNFIPPKVYFGIDMLIKDFLDKKFPVAKFLIEDYWIDIGRESDYKNIQSDYTTYFKKRED